MTHTSFIASKLHPLVRAVAHTAFVRGHTASDEEALGIVVSHYCEWDGLRILSAFEKALDDANFHAEAHKVRDMIAEVAAQHA
jgi:hypothetical protein